MKKILFSVFSAISLTACIQDAIVEAPKGNAIMFENPFIGNVTRSEAITNANIDAFQVWAYVNKPSGVLFTGENITRPDKNTEVWQYVNTQYWIPGNTYHFAAVAPKANNWTITMETEENPARTLTFTNDTDAATDLIYANKTVVSTSENNEVAFQFSHLLSNVKFSFSTDAFPENNIVTIHEIKVKTARNATIDLLTENKWTASDETVTIEPILDAQRSTDNYFIIPAECEISFKIKIEINDAILYESEQPKTAIIPADVFEMGHSYNLHADITPEILNFEELYFTVEDVEGWDEIGNQSDKVANLMYAAQIGGTYDLTDNLEVEHTIDVVKDLVINLNEHTLTYTGDNRLFKAKNGAVLTINGDGGAVEVISDNLNDPNTAAYIATAYDDSSIIINGGNHTTNGCTLYHANGGTVEINSGTFEATETGYDPAGKYGHKYTLNIQGNSGNFIVRGGSFKKYDPARSESESPVANFLAEGFGTVADEEWYKVIEVIVVKEKEDFNTAIQKAINETLEGERTEVNMMLANDIAIEGTIDVKANVDVILNLNGKNITIDTENFIPNSNGSQYVFIVREGGSLTIDGDGTIETTTPAPIFFYPAGDLIIESGTFVRQIPKDYNGSFGSMFVGTKPTGGWESSGVTIKGGYFDGGYYDEVSAHVEKILSGETELEETEQDKTKRGQPGDSNVTRNKIKNLISKTFNRSNNYFRVYGGTFVGANPAWGDEGCMLPTKPFYLRPWSYYQGGFIEGQEFNEDGIVLPAGYAITKGTHADGRPTYTVTYNK